VGAQTLPHDVCSRRNRETKPTIFKTLTRRDWLLLRTPSDWLVPKDGKYFRNHETKAR